MSDNKSLLASGLSIVGRNKRYIVWFFLLNVLLAMFGAHGFREQAHAVLDKSLLSDRLVHGFDVMVLVEMMSRPEFGPQEAAATTAAHFALLFPLLTALFLPGVFAGFASTYRLPRDEFFRACGRNLWRYIRLLLIAGIVMGIAAAALFGLHGWLEEKAGNSTNELLVFEVQMTGLAIIFLIMTVFRIWFDLAEVDVVLSDQKAVRRSLLSGLRHTLRGLGGLLVSYVVTTLVAALILVAGILAWWKFVAPESIVGAFIVGQVILLLLLIPRFWQRGIAVAYWQRTMVAPVVAYVPVVPAPVVVPVVVPIVPGTAEV